MPASGKVYAQINGLKINEYKITNIQGKRVKQEKVNRESKVMKILKKLLIY